MRAAAGFRAALLAAVAADGSATSPATAHFWRNDSANLAVTAAWNRYLAATPLSDDVTSPDITDSPPVSLSWSIGTDMPAGNKDGVGCLIGHEFVVAGGAWENVTVRGQPPPQMPKTAPAFNPLMVYDTQSRTWSRGPEPPYVQGRGQGACTPTVRPTPHPTPPLQPCHGC